MSSNRWGYVVAFLVGGLIFGGLGFMLGDAGSAGPGLQSPSPEVANESAATTSDLDLSLPRRQRNVEQEVETVSAEDKTWMLQALDAEKERRLAAEIKDEDTGLVVLNKILEHGADPQLIIRDWDTFVRPLRHRAADAEVIHVTPETVNQIFGEFRRSKRSRVTFQFSAGVFNLDSSLRLDGLEFITLRGAGRDRSHLNCSNAVIFAQGVDNLHLADFSVTARSSSPNLIDVRKPTAAFVERIDFRGMDPGFYLGGDSYIAVDECSFDGQGNGSGFGGRVLSVRSLSFVYLRNCRSQELESFIYADGMGDHGGIVRLENFHSRFAESTGRFQGKLEVQMSGCRFEQYGRDDMAQGIITDLGGNVFTKAVDSSYPDLEAVLFRLGKEVVAIEPHDNLGRGNVAYFEVEFLGGLRKVFFNHPSDGPQLRQEEAGGHRGESAPMVSALEALRLALVVERGDKHWGSEHQRLGLEWRRIGQDSVRVWHVRLGYAHPIEIRADTGEVLPIPQ